MKKNVGTAPALYPHAACGDRGDERRKTHLDARRAHGDHRARPHIGQPCRAAFYQRLHQKGRKTFRQSRGRKHAARSGRSRRGERKQGGQIGAVRVGEGRARRAGRRERPPSPSNARWRTCTRRRASRVLSAPSTRRMSTKSTSTRRARVDYDTLKPVLFEFPTYSYLGTGEVLGKCLSFQKGS